MTAGLPDKIAKPVHEKLIGRKTKREKITAELYYQYLKTLVKLKAWKLNQRHEAPIRPLELIYVDPSEILDNYNENPTDNNIYSCVKSGSWDLDYKDTIKDSSLLNSIEQHFNEGVEWSETEHYMTQLRKFKNRESQWFRNTEDNLERKFDRLEELYNYINSNGYRRQDELQGDAPRVNDKIDHLLKEFNEVKVHIGREGQILLASGAHRTTIARALNIDKIPVRIICRHSLWQEKRDKFERTKNPSEELENHPDIQNLL